MDRKPSIEIFDSVIESIQKRTGRPEMPTGLKNLDDLIWGIHPKELTIIAARPSQGKTSLATQIAWNLASACPVLFLSLEMSSESVMERVFCNEMELNGWKLRTGDARQQALDMQDRFKSRLLSKSFEISEMGKTKDQVEIVLKDYSPRAVFVDHLQRISSLGYHSKFEALSDYISSMKEFAIRYDCAMVVCSQINRGGSREENAMDFLKGTGESEEAADTLLQCNWIGREDESLPMEKYKVSVIKQRHGPTDNTFLSFKVGSYKFTDWMEKFDGPKADKKWFD